MYFFIVQKTKTKTKQNKIKLKLKIKSKKIKKTKIKLKKNIRVQAYYDILSSNMVIEYLSISQVYILYTFKNILGYI